MNNSNKLPPINKNSNPPLNNSHSQINHKSLALLKKARKQAEEDAKLLANRIALLKQEEIKTNKKIEETKAKALEIYKLKLINEEKGKKKFRIKENAGNVDQISKFSNTMELKTTIEEKNNRKEAYNNMRKDRVDKIKEDKKLYQKKKLLNLKQIERKALEKKEMIKAQNIQGRLKIKEFFEKKKEKFQEEYQLEMTGEERMKFRKEMEILKMEKLEMDLITKLQSSQVLQKNAYEELENALMLPARDFEKKYIIAPKENAQQIETESQNLSKEIPQQKSEEISIIKNNNNEENSKMKKEILESKELVKEKTEQNKKKDDGEDKLEKDVKEQVEIEEKPIKEENIIEKNNKEEEKGELKEKS